MLLSHLEQIAAADGPAEVLRAIGAYLSAWPKERVANLQRIDGGWAPFDRDQNPLPINSLGQLTVFHQAVHRQCLALREASLQLTPEIMELGEMLTVANLFAEAISAPEFKEHSATVSTRTAILNLL